MSQEELLCRAEEETKEIAALLRQVETQDDLARVFPKLKKRFTRLAELMRQNRLFLPQERAPTEASEELFIELARLYERPGMQEWIEKAERQAIALLD